MCRACRIYRFSTHDREKTLLYDVAIDQGFPTRPCTTQTPSIQVRGCSVAFAAVAALRHRIFSIFWRSVFFFSRASGKNSTEKFITRCPRGVRHAKSSVYSSFFPRVGRTTRCARGPGSVRRGSRGACGVMLSEVFLKVSRHAPARGVAPPSGGERITRQT